MTLPKGLQFLQLGWWVLHAIFITLIYVWAYRRGRDDERTERGAPKMPERKPPVGRND
jgi:hypothetical protein